MIRCPDCGGSGEQTTSHRCTCPMCNGCGEVPLPEIMKERHRCAELVRFWMNDHRIDPGNLRLCVEAILKGTQL